MISIITKILQYIKRIEKVGQKFRRLSSITILGDTIDFAKKKTAKSLENKFSEITIRVKE